MYPFNFVSDMYSVNLTGTRICILDKTGGYEGMGGNPRAGKSDWMLVPGSV